MSFKSNNIHWYYLELHKQQKCDWQFECLVCWMSVSCTQQPVIHKTHCGLHNLYSVWSGIFYFVSFCSWFSRLRYHVTCHVDICLIWFKNSSLFNFLSWLCNKNAWCFSIPLFFFFIFLRGLSIYRAAWSLFWVQKEWNCWCSC